MIGDAIPPYYSPLVGVNVSVGVYYNFSIVVHKNK